MKEEKENVNEVGGKSNKNLKKMPPLMVIGIVVVLVMILAFLVYLITLADNAVYEVKNEVDVNLNNTDIVINEVNNVVDNNIDNTVNNTNEVSYSKPHSVEVQKVYDKENASLEMIDYSYDNENLVVKVKLTFKKKPDYEFRNLIVLSRVLIDDVYYLLEPMNTDRFEKVSDLEYIQTMRYDISSIEKNKNVKYVVELNHYDDEEWNDPSKKVYPINTWEFTKDLNVKEGTVNTYYFKDKYIKLNEQKEVKGYIPETEDECFVSLLGIMESDKYTRFIFAGSLEFMGDYQIEIIGEDGKPIVEKNKEGIDPNSIFEVLVENKVNLNQKVTINVYLRGYDGEGNDLGYLLDGTMTLNLKENMVEELSEEQTYEEIKWNDFIIKANSNVHEPNNQPEQNYIYVMAERKINGFVENSEYVYFYRSTDVPSIQEMVKNDRFDDISNGGFLTEDDRKFTYYGNFELPDEKAQEVFEKGLCEYQGETYTEEKLQDLSGLHVSDIKEETISGVKVYSYHVNGFNNYSVYFMNINDNVYKIEVPRCVNIKNEVSKLLSDIILNK